MNLRFPVHVLYNKDMESFATNLRDNLVKELKPVVREQANKMTREAKAKYFSGRPYLETRSGNLKRSIKKTIERVEFYLGYLAVTGGFGIYDFVPYAGVHIRDNRSDNSKFTIHTQKYMTVPVKGGPADTRIRKRAKDLHRLVPVFAKGKTPFLGLRRGDTTEPVFWLKKEVNIPPRVFVDEMVEDAAPGFVKAVTETVNNFLKSRRARKVFR